MTAKQNVGLYAPDGAKYGAVTDGVWALVSTVTSTLGTIKQTRGAQAPDGSIYFTITDGAGALT